MLPFNEGFPGDHRTLFLDLPFLDVLGNNPPHLFKQDAPILTVVDPRIRRRYNRRVVTEFQKADVIHKAATLRELVAADAPLEQIIKLHDEVYHLNLGIRTKVLKALRKKKMGAVPWSPRYQRLHDERLLWTLIANRHEKKHINMRFLRRVMRQVGSLDALEVS